MQPVWIIAHKGGSEEVVPGSLAAYDEAIRLGCDMVELDVRRLRDGTLVATHDPVVDGVAPAEPLLRVEEILELAGDAVRCDLELKEPGYVAEVLDLALRYAAPERLLLSSFLDDVVAEVGAAARGVATGLILGRAPDPVAADVHPEERLRACGATYMCPRVTLLDHGVVERGAAIGVQALVWTVNDPADLEALIAAGEVAGVITDVPGLALAVRARSAAP